MKSVFFLVIFLGGLVFICYAVWKVGKFAEVLIYKTWNMLFGLTEDQLAKLADEEKAAAKQFQEDEHAAQEAFLKKMQMESRAREFRVARSLGFKNAQEAREADEDGFDAMIHQEMERESEQELADFERSLVAQVAANNSTRYSTEGDATSREVHELRVELDKMRRGVKPRDDGFDDLVGFVVKDNAVLKGLLGRRL